MWNGLENLSNVAMDLKPELQETINMGKKVTTRPKKKKFPFGFKYANT